MTDAVTHCDYETKRRVPGSRMFLFVISCRFISLNLLLYYKGMDVIVHLNI